ncbi:hypothetical protein SAMN05444007_103175 [Cribrihabitans marinus]|uniref:Uncharacterized protein n=1 Tax=Cribrihabitans marinus TaxID=1227549 RepID=A0A1H6VRU5_9RHOB|nr:hypothetical protein [Cribrihabitans marinus]GGH25827.1 hypothetical protein GCM10010973_13220 [Cribrihabitans marinus]SEJ03370.1 hypothetical protein SAMN05444007_103175 [Cribrihabitans marinus]
MPTVEINGQLVTLTDGEARNLVRRLIRQTRLHVWNSPKFRFEQHYQNWSYHNRGHAVNLFLWVVETVGSATLPAASRANRLNSQKQRLERMLNPSGILNFYNQFARWQRDAARFARDMNTYMDRVRSGTTSTVRVLEITRDGSFLTLQACAALLSGGATAGASAAVAGGTGAGTALIQAAASSFIINEMENSATRLGRAMAGETVTVDETVEDVVNNALDSVADGMLGAIVGKFMGPLSDEITDAAERQIRRGNLLGGVSGQLTADQINGAVQDSIDQFIGRRPSDVRAMLREIQSARNKRAAAQAARERLMRNRAFRQVLERNLQARARRGG